MPVQPYDEQAIMQTMMEAGALAMEGLQDVAEEHWNEYVPVDTGNLRDTWQVSLIFAPDWHRVILLLTCGYPSDKAPDGAPYAVFVEFGTSHMGARAPLRLTGDAVAGSIPFAYRDACEALGLTR